MEALFRCRKPVLRRKRRRLGWQRIARAEIIKPTRAMIIRIQLERVEFTEIDKCRDQRRTSSS